MSSFEAQTNQRLDSIEIRVDNLEVRTTANELDIKEIKGMKENISSDLLEFVKKKEVMSEVNQISPGQITAMRTLADHSTVVIKAAEDHHNAKYPNRLSHPALPQAVAEIANMIPSLSAPKEKSVSIRQWFINTFYNLEHGVNKKGEPQTYGQWLAVMYPTTLAAARKHPDWSSDKVKNAGLIFDHLKACDAGYPGNPANEFESQQFKNIKQAFEASKN